jgi:hypothetical protein
VESGARVARTLGCDVWSLWVQPLLVARIDSSETIVGADDRIVVSTIRSITLRVDRLDSIPSRCVLGLSIVVSGESLREMISAP